MNTKRKNVSQRSSAGKTHKIAKGLGAISIAIGVMEILANRKVAEQVGIKKKAGLISAHGVREIVNGAAILAARNPTPFLWTRVAGDGLDLAMLGSRLRGHGSSRQRRYILLALAGVTVLTALDLMSVKKIRIKKHADEAMIADYKKRSGFPRPAYQMRGIASDLMVPGDMRTPAALSPALYEARRSTMQ